MAEQLHNWRKENKKYVEQRVLQSKLDCQTMANIMLSKLMKKTPEQQQNTFGVWVGITYKNAGTCKWEDFVPIIQQRCLETYGETCWTKQSLGDWEDEECWFIGFSSKN